MCIIAILVPFCYAKLWMRNESLQSMKYYDGPDLPGREYFHLMHADQQAKIWSQHLIVFKISWEICPRTMEASIWSLATGSLTFYSHFKVTGQVQGFRGNELIYWPRSFQSLYPIHVPGFHISAQCFFASVFQIMAREKCHFILLSWQRRLPFSLCVKTWSVLALNLYQSWEEGWVKLRVRKAKKLSDNDIFHCCC